MNAFTFVKLDRKLWSSLNFGNNTLSFRSSLKSFHIVFCVLLFGSTLSSSHAQTARFFSTDNKLSSTLINQVFEDDRGLIWVATEDGLNRLDGAKVEKFNHQAEDSTSILHNYVRGTYQLSDQTLLIGYFNGLQRYDYPTQRFYEIPMYSGDGTLMQPHITTMLERHNGEILIGTSGSGIFRLTKDKNNNYIGQLEKMVYSEFIQNIFEDKQQRLWVMTQDNGLFIVPSDSNAKVSHYFYENETESNLSCIIQADNGNIYLGKLNEGLYRFISEEEGFEKIPYTGCHLAIKDLYVVDAERIYVGTENNGMKVFNPQTETFADLSLGINKFDFAKSKVHSIMMDSSENLWLGIYQKGIALIPFKPNNFKYIGYQSISRNTIGSNSITALQKEGNDSGVMWVGTDGDGIYKLDAEYNQISHYLIKESTSVMCVYEDSNGTIWTGTYLNGLGSYHDKTDDFKFNNPILDSKGGKVDRIYALTEDGDKNLWIGTMGSGLFSLDLKTGKVTERNIPNTTDLPSDPKDYMQNNWINTLYYSSDNKLYIGTYNGLSCLDLDTNTFIFEDGLNHVLGHRIVYALHEDSQGNLWIGTSEGLYYKPKESWALQNYSTEDGLPSNVVCAIEEVEGNLWLSTHRGISKFNTLDKNFTNFYFNDGLQGNEFNKGAVTVGNQRSIYFGGINGISYFDPNQISEQGIVPEIRLTAFYLDNNQINASSRSGGKPILDAAILQADKVSLANNDNTFTMEFASKNFIDPQQLTYYYAVDDASWVSLQQGANTIRFTDLIPDNYTIRVKAKELGAFSPVKTFTVVVRPPWYGTLTAKIIYVLMFVAIAWVVISQLRQRHKIREKVRAQNYENQIKEAKIQFFTNISHEIKTPISLILNPLKTLMKSDQDQARQGVYRVMHRNSERILHLINQLMEMRKIDQGQIQLTHRKIDMVGFIEDICFLFEDQKGTKNISLNFQSTVPKLDVVLDPSYFDKTLLNLLSNAFKFTPEGGTIDIVLEPFTNSNGVASFRLGVKDNGIGVAEKDLNKIFDRFYRSNMVELHPKEGTGIGLHLTRSIVHLHKGHIYAINNQDQKGCTMIMELPLDCQSAVNTKKEVFQKVTSMNLSQTDPQHEQNQQTELSQVDAKLGETEIYKGRGRSRILIIDDDSEIRNYLSSELGEDYHVLEASNGKLGYSMILNQTPDLIISDVSMPVMDGVSLCRKIKKNININHIPVILLTARSREQDNILGLDIGADAYLAKPFNLEILKTTIKSIINNREMLKNSFSGNQMPEGQLPPIEMKSADEKLMERVTKYINDNLDNPELNVEKIAKEIGISRVHLYRKLKELTNQSTRDFVRNIRLKQAADLLASKNLSVTEVTYATGFSHVSKFSSSFKEFYGCSPKEYKSLHLKNAAPQDYMDSMAS